MTKYSTVSRIFGAFQRMQLDGYSSKSRSDGSLTSCSRYMEGIFFCNLRKLTFSMPPMLNAALSQLFSSPPLRTHLFHLQPLLPFFPSHFPKWTAAAAEKKPVFSLTPLSQTNSFVPNSGAEFPNPGFTDPWETMEISALSFSKISGGKKGLEICICRNYWRTPKIPQV